MAPGRTTRMNHSLSPNMENCRNDWDAYCEDGGKHTLKDFWTLEKYKEKYGITHTNHFGIMHAWINWRELPLVLRLYHTKIVTKGCDS